MAEQTKSKQSDKSSSQSSNKSNGQSSNENSSATSERVQKIAQSAASTGQDMAEHYVTEPAKDLVTLAKDFVKKKPDVAAMWCFGLGLIVGWKLKP